MSTNSPCRETADEILEEYYKTIGGREAAFAESEKAARGKKRGRQSTGAQGAGTKRSRKSAAHPKDTSPPATKKWTPPSGSWEDEIDKIDACEEEGSGKLVVYLNWKNGHKTKHETAIIYKKCPQKVGTRTANSVLVLGRGLLTHVARCFSFTRNMSDMSRRRSCRPRPRRSRASPSKA